MQSKKLGEDCFEHVEGEITLWTKDMSFGPVTAAWIQYGQCVVPIKGMHFDTALNVCRNLVSTGMVPCSTCGKILAPNEVAGSHFAGRYCKEHWEEYMRKNSRKCRICGSPLYECCC